MRKIKILVLTFLTFISVNAISEDDLAVKIDESESEKQSVMLLQGFFEQAKQIKTNFKQTSFDASGQVMQQVEGVLSMSRPNRFRWDYQKPYEQMILADGTKLWVFDKDLDQVTVRDQANAIKSTPASILTEGYSAVAKQFNTSLAGETQGVKWVRFTPKDSNSEYNGIMLGFKGEQLQVIQIMDKFDQVTFFEFDNLQLDAELADDLFTFTPPKGVDVIGIDK